MVLLSGTDDMILPDILQCGLKLVISGTAVGKASATRGQYYADPSNQFWDVLFRTGLTPIRLQPQDYQKLPEYGIGLTDLAKVYSGTDAVVPEESFDIGGLKSKVLLYEPRVLAFNGKHAGQKFFGRQEVNYGCQEELLGETVIFVLPSTSGAARGYWDDRFWQELATFVKTLDP